MRFVHSFWFKPALDLYGSRFNGGFLTQRHFYYSWALSFQCISRKYSETVLVTDRIGQEQAKNFLQLPYSEISTQLEDIRPSRTDFWNYGKFIAYRLQSKPFAHIDLDAYLWKALPTRFLGAACFVQSWEELPEHQNFYALMVKGLQGKLQRGIPYAVPLSPLPQNLSALNCGIFGGSNLSFIHSYADLVLDILDCPENRKGWEEVAKLERGEFSVSNCAIAVEQLALVGHAAAHSIRPEVFIEQPDRGDQAMLEAGLTHLVGDAKSEPRYMALLESRLSRDFPELKQRIDDAIPS